MNRLNQNNFLGLPTSTTWLVNAAFVAKMRAARGIRLWMPWLATSAS
jgi:hypothetical protein